MRKLISLLLAVCMLLSLGFLVPASADEIVKLTWAQGTGGDAPVDNAMVVERLNEISREKLGVEVDILYFNNEQISTATNAGEVYDMYFTCGWFFDYISNSRDGIFADITDEVKEITPALYNSMTEDVWNLSAVDGHIYMIPVAKDIGYQCYFTYNKEFYDSIGMKWPERIDKFDEITPYLAAYAEHHPGEYGMMIKKNLAGIGAAGIFQGVTHQIVFNLDRPELGLHSLFEDEDFLERCAALHNWMEAGYVNPDAATTTSVDYNHDHVKLEAAWDGYDFSGIYGYPAGMCKIGDVYLAAGTVRVGNALSSSLEDDPERLALCLKYQEFVNTDREYRDILRYGVEGVHFNYREEDGAVIRTEQGANYQPWGFAQGSYVISSIETTEGQPIVADQWEQAYASYATARVAPDYGFAFDREPVFNEAAEVQVVIDKWYDLIASGTVEPYEAAKTCMVEMREAGYDTLLAEVIRQYDEFMAAREAALAMAE